MRTHSVHCPGTVYSGQQHFWFCSPLSDNWPQTMRIQRILLITLLVMLIVYEFGDARRGKGSRRRKMRKQNSKILFVTNSKRADYYMNKAVSSNLADYLDWWIVADRERRSSKPHSLITNSISDTRFVIVYLQAMAPNWTFIDCVYLCGHWGPITDVSSVNYKKTHSILALSLHLQ